MKSGGGSFGHLGMYVGEDWWTHLSTYDDHSPILDVDARVDLGVAVRRRPQDRRQSAVEFARELAAKAARFAAEVERLHAQDHDGGEACDGAAGAAGMVRRPDGVVMGGAAGTGIPAAPVSPPAGAWRGGESSATRP